MTYKIPKESIKRLAHHSGPIPDGCEDTVKLLLELDADVFWATCIAVIVRMDKKNTFRLKEIIAEMLKDYPKQLVEFREMEDQFDEYFKEMDEAVSLRGLMAIEEDDEP
jgi:hypothetical protein